MTSHVPVLPGVDAERDAADRVVGSLDLPIDGIPVHDPADGSLVARVPDLSVEAALDAVGIADRAGAEWALTTLRRRADVLLEWWRLLVANTEELAHLITREMGKPLAEARGEVKYGSDFVRWYAEQAVRPAGEFRDLPDGSASLLTRRAPVGLSVLITPWNFPLAMATRKIAPALAAGCAAIVKPATATPLTTYFAVELARRAGVPEGLVQVVTTSDSRSFSEQILRDPRVRKVSFTGSTEVGRTLLRIASDQVLRTSMELGGNAPALVFDDADLERAVDGVFDAKLRNGGQSCIAANRIFVQSGIADAFVEALSERFAAVKVGSGFASDVRLGPLIDKRATAQMATLTRQALDLGAELRAGSADAFEHGGSYFPAVVLDRVPEACDIASEEIFGPIAAIQRFETQGDAIRAANATPFGLAGYVFTSDLDRALNVADALETGLVGINQGVPSNAAAPFGGTKQSGLGREGSAEGLEEYQSTRFYNISRIATA